MVYVHSMYAWCYVMDNPVEKGNSGISRSMYRYSVGCGF
jgi:hypothetical protein